MPGSAGPVLLGCGTSGQGQNILVVAGKVLMVKDEDADDDDPAQSHKSCATVDYTPIGVEPHRPTRGVWPIATVANDSQLHLVASSI